MVNCSVSGLTLKQFCCVYFDSWGLLPCFKTKSIDFEEVFLKVNAFGKISV